MKFGCCLLLLSKKIIPHKHDIIKNFITVLKLMQVVKKFTYKSAVVTDCKANSYDENVLNCKASLKTKLFAFQIARHLAFIVKETKLRYTMSLFLRYAIIPSFLPSVALLLVLLIAHLQTEIQKCHNTTTNVPALPIIRTGSFALKPAMYCMLCICW